MAGIFNLIYDMIMMKSEQWEFNADGKICRITILQTYSVEILYLTSCCIRSVKF